MSQRASHGFPQKIGQFEVTLDQVLRDLRFNLVLQPTTHKIACQHLIRTYADKEGIKVSDAELQNAVDDFRKRSQLLKAAEVMEYLKIIGLSTEDLEWEMETDLLGLKVKEKLFSGRVNGFFVENQMDFEEIEIRHLVVAAEAAAKELLTQMKEDRTPFAALAKKHSLDVTTKRNGGYLGWVRRGRASAEIERVIFGAKPGEVKGPFKVAAGFELIEVIDKDAPQQPTDAIRGEIIERLFAKEFMTKYLPPDGKG